MQRLAVLRHSFPPEVFRRLDPVGATAPKSQFAAEAIDFTRVVETFAFAKNLIFGLQ
jgi:hypothetical protein